MKPIALSFPLLVFAVTSSLLAQTTPQDSSGGWRRVGDAPAASAQTDAQQAQPQQDPTQPVAPTDSYGQPAAQAPQAPTGAPQNPQANAPHRPAYGVPAELTVKPGTFVTVRINQFLNSDKNHPGDTFTASLAQPLVVDGVVVAVRGQTVYGNVVEAEKAHSGHPSRLKLVLTGISLADGTQTPISSQLVASTGPRTPNGVQAGTIVGTTAVGAGVGAVAAGGTGAAIGAGAGAAVGIVGVLLTRDHPTIVYPETPLTFQITSPITVSTVHAPQAFRYATPQDYERPAQMAGRPAAPGYHYGPGAYGSYYAPGYYSPYYAYPYYYGYPYYPNWGPTVGIGFGWGWGGGWGRRWR
ncbi:MAG: hypothetical protein ABSH49_04065 [Bryobacteraceae bacterium]